MLLVLLDSLLLLNSMSIVDTARDMYHAWQISTASEFATQGPSLALAIHLGPAWFYLLSLPLVLKLGWLGAALWVGFLSALKYPFAFATGRLLVGERFGLVLAALLALPGWAAINYLVFSHTSIVLTTTLASLYCLLRLRISYQTVWFIALGLCLSLALHAHVSAYAVAALAGLVLIHDAIHRRYHPAKILVAGLFALVPLAPYLVSQQLAGWPDWQTSTDFVQSTSYPTNILTAYQVLVGTVVDGTRMVYRYMFGLLSPLGGMTASILAWAQVGLLSGFSLYGVSRFTPDDVRQTSLKLLGSLVLVTVLVAAVRDRVPFYMSFVIYPFLYATTAWGIERTNERLRRIVFRILMVLAPVSLILFHLATFSIADNGTLTIGGQDMTDIRSRSNQELRRELYFPARARPELADWICSRSGELILHGDLALIVERSYGLEYRMQCGKTNVQLGGQGTGEHWLGLSHDIARAVNASGERVIGSLTFFTPASVVFPREGMSVPEGRDYPPRPILLDQTNEETVRFDTNKGELVAITNLYDFWARHQLAVTADGETQKPVIVNTATSLYRCDRCPGETVTWEVSISGGSPEHVEIVTFQGKSAGRR